MIVKKIVPVFAVLLLVGCAFGGCGKAPTLANAEDQKDSILTARAQISPPLSGVEYPSDVFFGWDSVGNNSIDSTWRYMVERGDNFASWDWSYGYFPVSASCSYGDSYWRLDSVTFARVSLAGASISPYWALKGYPYTIGAFSASSSALYLYQTAHYFAFDQLVESSKMTPNSSSRTFGVTNSADKSLWVSVGMTLHSAGPYYVYFEMDSMLDFLEPLLYPYFATAQDSGYQRGYEVGVDQGRKTAQDLAYQEGYSKGLSDASASKSLLMSLFGAIVSVPVNAINGLSPLAIWDVPIISIVITLLMLSVILWFIKRIIK